MAAITVALLTTAVLATAVRTYYEAGNAFHLLHAPATAAPWHEMPLADVCALVRALALRPLQLVRAYPQTLLASALACFCASFVHTVWHRP